MSLSALEPRLLSPGLSTLINGSWLGMHNPWEMINIHREWIHSLQAVVEETALTPRKYFNPISFPLFLAILFPLFRNLLKFFPLKSCLHTCLIFKTNRKLFSALTSSLSNSSRPKSQFGGLDIQTIMHPQSLKEQFVGVLFLGHQILMFWWIGLATNPKCQFLMTQEAHTVNIK